MSKKAKKIHIDPTRFRVGESGSTNGALEHPIFCFKHLSKNDFSLDECSKDEKAALVDKLKQLSELSWNQIICAPRHGCGSEKIARDAIRAPIPQHVTEDVTLTVLRFDAKKAMVGYRAKSIFHILWLDTKFNLYDHGS